LAILCDGKILGTVRVAVRGFGFGGTRRAGMLARRKSVVALLGVAGLLVASAVFASGAMAAPPTTVYVTASGSVTIPAGALCNFPIELEGTQTFKSTTFYDNNGAITERNTHGFEQDTFSANGKTLQGEPYPFNFFRDFVDGVSVSFYGIGVAERDRTDSTVPRAGTRHLRPSTR
jgi:hypothetical protein